MHLMDPRQEHPIKTEIVDYRVAMEGILDIAAKLVEMHNPYKRGHHKRVAGLSYAIAEEMGLSKDVCYCLWITGSIHDIGEISVPVDILCKATKLTHIEFILLKEHPRHAYNMIKDVEFPWPVAEIILQHHERLDGSGYPSGLKDRAILVEAKTIAVADVLESMISDRPYHFAIDIDRALKEIEKEKGTLYDPFVVDTCTKLFRKKGFRF